MRNFSKSIFLLQKEGKFLIYFKIEIIAQERFFATHLEGMFESLARNNRSRRAYFTANLLATSMNLHPLLYCHLTAFFSLLCLLRERPLNVT